VCLAFPPLQVNCGPERASLGAMGVLCPDPFHGIEPSSALILAGRARGFPSQRRKLDDISRSPGAEKTNSRRRKLLRGRQSKTKTRTTREEHLSSFRRLLITWPSVPSSSRYPEEYTEKGKKWRMSDFPIVPPTASAVPRYRSPRSI